MKDTINGDGLKKEVGWGRHIIKRNGPTFCIFNFFYWVAVKPLLLEHWQAEWDTHTVCTPLHSSSFTHSEGRAEGILIRCLNQLTLTMKKHRFYSKLFPDIWTFPDGEPRYPTKKTYFGFFHMWLSSSIHCLMQMTISRIGLYQVIHWMLCHQVHSPFSTPLPF